MQDDATLLQLYAETRSETAFAELVKRHLNLVYSAALRQVAGDSHLAEDIVQSVFTDLARKSESVARRPVLAGWLHTSTHYAAAKVIRSERRRRQREQSAQAMEELLNESPHDAEWSRLRPVLDGALKELRPDDRDAILLRFFEGHGFAAIGARLRLSENAVRMRVDRALDRLRARLMRRGIGSTSAALATALAGQVVTAAPATLAGSVTHAAVVAAGSGGAAFSLLHFMALTKTQMAVAGALVLGGGTTLLLQHQAEMQLQTEIAELRPHEKAVADLRAENRRLAQKAALVATARGEATEQARLTAELKVLVQQREAARTAASAARTKARLPSTPLSGDVYDISKLDQLPKPIKRQSVEYPFEFRSSGISGEAVLDLTLDAEGAVHDLHAVKATHTAFATAAIEAVSQWKFTPGEKAGRPVPTHLQVPIVFVITPDEPDWF